MNLKSTAGYFSMFIHFAALCHFWLCGQLTMQLSTAPRNATASFLEGLTWLVCRDKKPYAKHQQLMEYLCHAGGKKLKYYSNPCLRARSQVCLNIVGIS